MNKKLAVNIIALILVSGSLGGMLLSTDIYDDIKSGIVDVLCLSCIKLDPKTSMDFTFETVDNKEHPDFIKNRLGLQGPILIQYGDDGCAACINMIDNVMSPRLGISFPKDDQGEIDYKQSFEKEITIENVSFYYIYINIDHIRNETKENSWKIYDIEDVGGFPQFTIITIEYHHGGDIKPYYTTINGAFGNNWDEAKVTFMNLLGEAKELYERNIAGFK